ncbi:RNA-binding protein 25 [Mycetomoellerius zeteki]|uniref:RNA-binding protein 25 n=1 Tax=Mycetomoellerius zeteki TaxID=64791 RepID=UPI00084E715C|nr:PREDICTED: RNA-binding protein 25-like [Trachymyrmex zeteki]
MVYMSSELQLALFKSRGALGVSLLFGKKRSVSSRIIRSLCTAITMDSRKKWRFTLEEQERLRLKRKEWRIQQKKLIKHEILKSRKIEEFERKRKLELMKNSDKQESLQQSKSSNPQRRETSSPDYKHSNERKTSVIFNGPEGIIDKKELHKIKIRIKTYNLPTNYQITSNNIEWDIINPNDVILPRRKNEGPISKRIKIEKSEEIRKITFSQNEQLEKELSTSRKNASTSRNLHDDIIHHYWYSPSRLLYKSTMCRNDRIDDNKRYNRDRRRYSSTRESEEEDRDRNKRRNRNSIRYSSHSASFTRDRSRSRYRNRSRSPTSERGRERKKDNNEISKFLSRNYSDQSCSLDNCAFSKSHSSLDSFYSSYVRLPRPMLMPMPRVQAPPMLMTVFPGSVLPTPFPPMNIYRWQQPCLRFVNGRGIGIHNNR